MEAKLHEKRKNDVDQLFQSIQQEKSTMPTNVSSISDIQHQIYKSINIEPLQQLYKRKKQQIEKQKVESVMQSQRSHYNNKRHDTHIVKNNNLQHSQFKSHQKSKFPALYRQNSHHTYVRQHSNSTNKSVGFNELSDEVNQGESSGIDPYADYEGQQDDNIKDKKQNDTESDEEYYLKEYKDLNNDQNYSEYQIFKKSSKRMAGRKVCMEVCDSLNTASKKITNILSEQEKREIVRNLTSLKSIFNEAKKEIKRQNISKGDFLEQQEQKQQQKHLQELKQKIQDIKNQDIHKISKENIIKKNKNSNRNSKNLKFSILGQDKNQSNSSINIKYPNSNSITLNQNTSNNQQNMIDFNTDSSGVYFPQQKDKRSKSEINQSLKQSFKQHFTKKVIEKLKGDEKMQLYHKMKFSNDSYKYPVFRNDIKRPYQSVKIVEQDDLYNQEELNQIYKEEDSNKDGTSISSREVYLKDKLPKIKTCGYDFDKKSDNKFKKLKLKENDFGVSFTNRFNKTTNIYKIPNKQNSRYLQLNANFFLSHESLSKQNLDQIIERDQKKQLMNPKNKKLQNNNQQIKNKKNTNTQQNKTNFTADKQYLGSYDQLQFKLMQKQEKKFNQPFIDIYVENNKNIQRKLTDKEEFLLSSCVGMLTLHQNLNNQIDHPLEPYKFDTNKQFFTIPFQGSKDLKEVKKYKGNVNNDKKIQDIYHGKIQYIHNYALIQDPVDYILETDEIQPQKIPVYEKQH